MNGLVRLLCIALLTTTAYAEQPATTTETTKKETAKKEKLTPTELQVVAHYHMVNMLEIDLGKVAQKNAANQAVKSYGEMMIKEHTEADKKLNALAKSTGQTIPAAKPETDAEKQEMAETKKNVAALKKLKGADFDREYLRMMVTDHDRELARIDTNMAKVQNAQLLDILSATKPMLQQHADAARELQKSNPQASHQHKK